MTPIRFPEQTTYSDERETISLWRLTWRERLRILFGAKLWLRQCNFGKPLQPILPTLDAPFVEGT